MRRADRLGITMWMACGLFAGQPCAADDAALLRDLTSAIAVLGLPCGKVLSAARRAEHDHIASCRDGNRYRVFINAQGRVVAQRQ